VWRRHSQAVAVMQPLGEDAVFLELVREALREFGPDGPEAEVLLAAWDCIGFRKAMFGGNGKNKRCVG